MSGDQMLQRRGLAADWASTNPILGDGEIGITQDTLAVKIGDGVTSWNDLESLMDLLSRVAKVGDIMTGRLQLPELGVTESDTLTLYLDDGLTLGKLSAGAIYDNGKRVYSESNPPTGGVSMQFEEFLTDGTFQAPKAGWYKVFAVGGGGGSGGVLGATSNRSASGGGGGGEVVEKLVELTLGEEVAVTIGAGGTAGAATPTDGGHGGDTSFGAYLTALGGGGGGYSDYSAGDRIAPSAASKASSGGGGPTSSSKDVYGGNGGGAGGHAEVPIVDPASGTTSDAVVYVSKTTKGRGGEGTGGAIKPASYQFIPKVSSGHGIRGYGVGGSGGVTTATEAQRQLSMPNGGVGAFAYNSSVVGTAGATNTGSGGGGSAVYNSVAPVTGAAGGTGYLAVEWME